MLRKELSIIGSRRRRWSRKLRQRAKIRNRRSNKLPVLVTGIRMRRLELVVTGILKVLTSLVGLYRTVIFTLTPQEVIKIFEIRTTLSNCKNR